MPGNPPMRRRAAARMAKVASVALSVLVLAASAWGQGRFPEKPVHIVVPSSAGSTLDVIARQIGERLSRELGQPIVVENKAGASGIIAYDQVAKAKPDGYTLGMIQAGFVSNRFLYRNAKYDEFRDYAAVATIARSPMILIARAGHPASTIGELRQQGRAKPGTMTYASINGANYMNTELARRTLDLDIRNIPYKEAGMAVSDVLAGHVDLHLASYSTAMPLMKSGKMKAFVTLGGTRIAAFGEVPTAKELGLAVDIHTWAGVLAPAGTPAQIVALLGQKIDAIVALPETRESLVNTGFEPMTLTPREFNEMMRAEIATYERVARELGVKPE